MAAIGPAVYSMENTRPRRIGLTRNYSLKIHPNAGANGKAECQEPSKEEDVYRPPVDSSDEDDGKSQAKKRSRSPSAGLGEPNHPMTSSQRGKQSRKCEPVEDELPSSFESQPRRSQKRGYTYGKTPNIHEHVPKRRSQESQSSQTSSGPQINEKGGRLFNIPPTNLIKLKTPLPAQEQSGFHQPPEGRHQVSQRSQQSAQDDSRPEFKFPGPKPLNPKVRAKDSSAPFNSYGAPPRATRSSQACSRSPANTGTGSSQPKSGIHDAMATSADILGMMEHSHVSGGVVTGHGTLPLPIPNCEDEICETDPRVIGEPTFLNADGQQDSSFPQDSHPTVTSRSSDVRPDAKCPLCGTVVDKLWYEEATGGRRLTMRQQAAFCRDHKVKSAHEQWRERGFPDIDWSHFDQRLETYHPKIEEMLRGDKSSFYRNVFEDTVRAGKTRTLKQAMMQGADVEDMTPGYYGSRGAKMVVDNIIARFSSKLRRLAGSDKLIAAGGVSGYVQAVLAPELAMMLVMDDMRVDEDGAREILRESVDIGNLLNEEEDEVLVATHSDVDELTSS